MCGNCFPELFDPYFAVDCLWIIRSSTKLAYISMTYATWSNFARMGLILRLETASFTFKKSHDDPRQV